MQLGKTHTRIKVYLFLYTEKKQNCKPTAQRSNSVYQDKPKYYDSSAKHVAATSCDANHDLPGHGLWTPVMVSCCIWLAAHP